MIKYLIVIFSFILNQSYCQYSLDNSITCVNSQSQVNNFTLSYSGNNTINIKKVNINLTDSYVIGYKPVLYQNEFSQKLNISYKPDKYFTFVFHQLNYSMIRQITLDNLIGIGGGITRQIKNFKYSISYAVLVQKTEYLKLANSTNLRHSIRIKLNYSKGIFSFLSDYYFQPSMINTNHIITGNTKLSIKTLKNFNLTIQDILNYSNLSKVKLIHTSTIGVSYVFSK